MTQGSSSVLVVAAQWIQAVLLGSTATTIAILATAAAGLALLNGRGSIRRFSTVIVGCFILFAAPTIANGLITAVELREVETTSMVPSTDPLAASTTTPPISRAAVVNPFDPYSRAGTPSR